MICGTLSHIPADNGRWGKWGRKDSHRTICIFRDTYAQPHKLPFILMENQFDKIK